MTNTPLFPDTSIAGYDHILDRLTRQAAHHWGLDPHDPPDRMIIIERLNLWTDKLRRHTPSPPPGPPTKDHPF